MNKVIIFSAPSGAGKTTIAKDILKRISSLEFSVSACSRPKRKDEKEGVDYYFLSVDEFKRKINNDEFLEWQEVYPGSFYGTLKTEVERIWNNDKDVMFDIDTFGGLNVKNIFKEKALSIFIITSSVEVLENRLRSRNTETEDSLKKRMDKAKIELSRSTEFDKIIVNDRLKDAIDEAYKTITNFLRE
jgi:guanylate kinase